MNSYNWTPKNNLIKNGQRAWINIYPKKTYKWPIDPWIDAQHHLSPKKCKSTPQWDTTSHLSEWLKSKPQEMSIVKDVEKKNPLSLLVEMQTSTTTVENSMKVPQKIKNGTTIWSNNSSIGYLPKEYGNTNWKDICTPIFTAALFTIVKLRKQTKCLSIGE